jgi:CHAT domain-containing protein
MTKGEALQQAKLKLIADHRHPFYWSPFVLIGDAR